MISRMSFMLAPSLNTARNLVFFDVDNAPAVVKALGDKGIRGSAALRDMKLDARQLLSPDRSPSSTKLS